MEVTAGVLLLPQQGMSAQKGPEEPGQAAVLSAAEEGKKPPGPCANLPGEKNSFLTPEVGLGCSPSMSARAAAQTAGATSTVPPLSSLPWPHVRDCHAWTPEMGFCLCQVSVLQGSRLRKLSSGIKQKILAGISWITLTSSWDHLRSQIAAPDSSREATGVYVLRKGYQELCLHTKLLAPVNCPIVDSKAPDPPPALIVRNAVQMLKTIDAMDPWEDLTELGYCLTELPVEPHLGKMVVCAVVLKCLDPVLTIVCTLAYQDPFVLPTVASQKRAAMLCRKCFTVETFSDHMVLLRAFQAWQQERAFCAQSFLSPAPMEVIVGMRARLLGLLRASGFVRARAGGADIRDISTNSETWAVVKAALVAGMCPGPVPVDRESLVLTGPQEKEVRCHLTSVLGQPEHKQEIKHRAMCGFTKSFRQKYDNGLLMVVHKGRVSNDDSDSEMEDQRTANLALLKLGEWLHLGLDPERATKRIGSLGSERVHPSSSVGVQVSPASHQEAEEPQQAS
ncbi:LOW QUALITY PROTEIN: 3'-5' RNA helicase YTHDC2-like [Podargus strigoides]